MAFTDNHQIGRAIFTLTAPPLTKMGTVGYLKACFVNTRGDAGPMGEPFKFIVN